MIEAGLYHGSRALCETRTTQEISVSESVSKVEEDLTFSVAVCNIPRNTRLCLAIYEVSRSAKATKARSSIGSRQVRECFFVKYYCISSFVSFHTQDFAKHIIGQPILAIFCFVKQMTK